jgi:hypothetical protein
MDLLAAILVAKLDRTRAQVSFFVVVNFKRLRQQAPHPYVKLTSLVQQWLFDVFLNDPEGLSLLLFENEFQNISHIAKDLDTLALVESGRLHHPHILVTVLDRHPFLLTASVRYFSEALHEIVHFALISRSRDHERRWRCVEACVACIFRLLLAVVIGPQRSDQVSFGANPVEHLEVIEKDRFFARKADLSLINGIVAVSKHISLPPVEIHTGQMGVFLLVFWNALPIASRLECVDYMARKVALTDRIHKFLRHDSPSLI